MTEQLSNYGKDNNTISVEKTRKQRISVKDNVYQELQREAELTGKTLADLAYMALVNYFKTSLRV